MIILLLCIQLFKFCLCEWEYVLGDPLNNFSFSVVKDLEDFHPDNVPGGRYWPGFLDFNEHLTFLFGGGGYHLEDEAHFLCDLWIFDSDILMWKFVKGCLNYGGFYYETGTDDFLWSKFTFPGGRQCPSLFHHPFDRDRFFLFGGYYFNSEYDVNVNWWRMIQESFYESTVTPEYSMIGARACSHVWEDGNGAKIFGGAGGKGDFNDLWNYDVVNDKYDLLSGNFNSSSSDSTGHYTEPAGTYDSENSPASRYSGMTWRSPQQLFLFGGRSAGINVFFNDLWTFHTNISQWACWKSCEVLPWNITLYDDSVINTTGVFGAGNLPSRRRCSFVWQMGLERAFLFGGDMFDDQEMYAFGDLWEFDMELMQFRCLLFCGGEWNETVDRLYNETYPNIINARTAGMSYKDRGGNLMLSFGYFSSNEVWRFSNDDDILPVCRNVSIYEKGRQCSGHGDCFNDTCLCHNNNVHNNTFNYTGDECQYWDCYGVHNYEIENVCNGHGECYDHNRCDCSQYLSYKEHYNLTDWEEYEEDDDSFICSQYTCFFELPQRRDRVCNGEGTCEDLNVCNCTGNYYGEQCQEMIIEARMADYQSSVHVKYFIRPGYIRNFERFFNCSLMIENYKILGRGAQCSWDARYRFRTEKLAIFLGVGHKVGHGKHIRVIPVTNNATVAVLRILPEIKEFDWRNIFLIIFVIFIVLASMAIVVVLIILIILIVKNISMWRELRQQNRLLAMIEQPCSP